MYEMKLNLLLCLIVSVNNFEHCQEKDVIKAEIKMQKDCYGLNNIEVQRTRDS